MQRISEIPFRDESIEFHVESGVVMGVCRHSETYVSGGGSSGVSTSVHRWTEFSIVNIDGVERPHYFNSHSMFLRNGHRASLIHASCGKSNWAYIINHDTRLVHNCWDPSDFVFHLGLVRYFSWWWLLAILFLPAFVGWEPLWPIGFSMFLALKITQWVRAYLIWKRHLHKEFERIKELLLAATDRIPWHAATRQPNPTPAMPVPPPLPPSHSMA